eukprot:4810152-Amphidinium_carterae.5
MGWKKMKCEVLLRPTVQLGTCSVHVIPEVPKPDEATLRHHIDCGYFTLGGGPRAQRMSDVRYSVFLVATDNSSGEVFASIVKRKGRGEVDTYEIDGEAILKELCKRVNIQVMLRAVPRGSSASNGPTEQRVQSVASSLRTMLWDLQLEETVEPDDRVLTWLVPYCAWSHNRFSHDINGVTPYEKATGQKYTGCHGVRGSC